jgi:hypothetical protein
VGEIVGIEMLGSRQKGIAGEVKGDREMQVCCFLFFFFSFF